MSQLLTRLGVWLQSRSTATEGKSRFDGVLSYAAEWHSVIIGVGVGMAGSPQLQTQIVGYAVGRGGRQRQLADDPHIRDLADEPAYAMAGISVGRALRGLPVAAGTILSALPL